MQGRWRGRTLRPLQSDVGFSGVKVDRARLPQRGRHAAQHALHTAAAVTSAESDMLDGTADMGPSTASGLNGME